MRIVLDTSVLVAAVRSSAGASNFLLTMALRQEFELLISVPMLLEYEAVLTRPDQLAACGFDRKDVLKLVDTLGDRATHVHLGFFWQVPAKDVNDSHVLTLAVVGRAEALVTHNVRDFSAEASAAGISLYTPANVLLRLRS